MLTHLALALTTTLRWRRDRHHVGVRRATPSCGAPPRPASGSEPCRRSSRAASAASTWSASSAGSSIGQALGGLVAEQWGLTAPFWFAFVGSGMILVLIWRQLAHIAHADESARSDAAAHGRGAAPTTRHTLGRMARPPGKPALAPFGTTIFAEMTALATEHGAINLGQGFPDTDGPREMLEAAEAAIDGGRNQYPPGPGVPELRAAVAEHQSRFYGLTVDPRTEVLVTVGATEAIAATMLALCEPGDEVVTFEPYYDSYAASIALAGAVRRTSVLRFPDFAVDEASLRAAFSAGTRMVLLNTPHNPTGKVFTPRRDRPDLLAGTGVRRVGGDRRGLRAPGLRRRGARAGRDAAGHVGADADDLVGGQDVLGPPGGRSAG